MSGSPLHLTCTPAFGLDETSLYLSISPPSLPVCCLRGFCQKLDPIIGVADVLQNHLRALPLAFQGSWVCSAQLNPHPCSQSRQDFLMEHILGLLLSPSLELCLVEVGHRRHLLSLGPAQAWAAPFSSGEGADKYPLRHLSRL